MSQTTEDILNGIMCQQCGQWMPEIGIYWNDPKKLNAFFNHPPGHPRTCPDCDATNETPKSIED